MHFNNTVKNQLLQVEAGNLSGTERRRSFPGVLDTSWLLRKSSGGFSNIFLQFVLSGPIQRP